MTEKELVIDMRELIDDIKEKTDNNQSVVLKGEGVSMYPFITDKDILTLQKPKSDKPKTGEIYLYRRSDGSYAIHRVYAVRKDFVFMLGDSQLFIEKVQKSCLVAIVSTVEKTDKRIDCTDFSVRLKSVLHMKTRIFKASCKSAFVRLLNKIIRPLSKFKKKLMKER